VVLDAGQHDPWLSAVVAVARGMLGIGPDPTLSQRLWLTVDGLSLLIDDPDEFEEGLEESALAELLAERGGVVAAAALDHPQTREVLRAVVPQLDDEELAGSLRKALNGGKGRPARGRRKPR
jgi:hypothetical protein